MLVAMMLEGGVWGRVYLRVSLADVQVPPESAVVSTEQPVMAAAGAPAAPLVATRPAPTLPPPRNTISVSTAALLRSASQVSPEVFLASLRRGGQRDAVLLTAEGKTGRVQIGEIVLELQYFPRPMSRATLEYALSQSFDWPDAATEAGACAAHVIVTTVAPEDLSRVQVVRCHCRAHLALAEFASVAGVLWIEAGRLMATGELKSLAVEKLDPTSVCMSFRTFGLEGEEAGKTLCDTAGLHAFSLPDLQIIVEGDPDEAISTALYEWAGRIFERGCVQAEGEKIQIGGGEFIVGFDTSRFDPRRRVMTLNRQ
jgi:hypothetical protein